MNNYLLEIRNLNVHFFTDIGVLKILNDVDLRVNKKETLGLVGESGCGKTMTARAILRLIPHPGQIVSGEIFLDGKNLLNLSKREMQKVRGDALSMVFQEPVSSLNPLYKIGGQITEILAAHRPEMSRKDRKDRTIELLEEVGIPSPERRFYDYPFQFSGGQCQRVVIAMALACGNPRLLIADEPTTALDVTIQAQILELFKDLQEKMGMSIILITHDLGVIADVADQVAVMYAGSIVEYTDVTSLYKNPLHPYTIGLLKSLPELIDGREKEKLYTIPGVMLNPSEFGSGCKFFNRCIYGQEDICSEENPALLQHERKHWVRCVKAGHIKE